MQTALRCKHVSVSRMPSAAAYVENMGTAKVLDKLRIHKRIMTAVIAGVLVALLAWAGVVTWAAINADNSTHGYIEINIE